MRRPSPSPAMAVLAPLGTRSNLAIASHVPPELQQELNTTTATVTPMWCVESVGERCSQLCGARERSNTLAGTVQSGPDQLAVQQMRPAGLSRRVLHNAACSQGPPPPAHPATDSSPQLHMRLTVPCSARRSGSTSCPCTSPCATRARRCAAGGASRPSSSTGRRGTTGTRCTWCAPLHGPHVQHPLAPPPPPHPQPPASTPPRLLASAPAPPPTARHTQGPRIGDKVLISLLIMTVSPWPLARLAVRRCHAMRAAAGAACTPCTHQLAAGAGGRWLLPCLAGARAADPPCFCAAARQQVLNIPSSSPPHTPHRVNARSCTS